MSNRGAESKKINRKSFIGLIIGWFSVAFSLTGIGVAFLRFLYPNTSNFGSSKVRIGKPENFKVDSVTLLEDERIFILYNQTGFKAISAVCTHLRCTVKYLPQGIFSCPCHGSRFNMAGEVISGPAPKGLEWYKMGQKRDGSLIVNKKIQVDDREVFEPKLKNA